jgi:hypothetical protein
MKGLHILFCVFAVFILSWVAGVFLVKNEVAVFEESELSVPGEILTERSFTIEVLGSSGVVTRPLITAEGWCFLNEDFMEHLNKTGPFNGVYTKFIGVGMTPLGSYLVEGLGCDWFQFGFTFYSLADGTEHNYPEPLYSGRAREPPLYSTYGRTGRGFRRGIPFDLDEISSGGFLFKLVNVSLFLYDGTELYWENSDITIAYEFFRTGTSWGSTLSVNTTLPLQNFFDNITGTLTINISTIPTILWIHTTIISTTLLVIPTIILVIWKTRKRIKSIDHNSFVSFLAMNH